jgi:glycosyltransferase involved in cell wall biosynthesis
LKIAQVTYSGLGGLGSVVFSLISADRSHSHDWSTGFIGDLALDSSYQDLCKRNKVKYAAFRSTPGKPYRAWINLEKWLGSVKPAVVICHSINSILACRWYASRHGARLIAVEHTSNQVKTRNEWVASRVSMLLADRVVVLTDEYREELNKAHGWLYRPYKVRTIPNGIDTALFSPRLAQLQKIDKRIRLGMAARFSFSKRQDLLVDVMSKLADLRPDLSFELHLAGDGLEVDRVKNHASKSPIAPHIFFDGLLNEQQIADWLRHLDVYVHATDCETLSTSLLQAMATGLPIVASGVNGVTNLLGSAGDYGVCVANDAEGFALAILRIVDSPELSKLLGSRARDQILSCYSNQLMLERYLAVIAECR